MPRPTLLLLANLCTTGMLVGLAWTVQLVHYPLLAAVGAEAFPAYLAAHATRMTILVAPWMVAELVTALALLRWPPPSVPRWMLLAGAGLCLVLWGSTFLVQVPLHERLAAGQDLAVIDRLVATNWLRTAAWTARGTLSLLMIRALVISPTAARSAA